MPKRAREEEESPFRRIVRRVLFGSSGAVEERIAVALGDKISSTIKRTEGRDGSSIFTVVVPTLVEISMEDVSSLEKALKDELVWVVVSSAPDGLVLRIIVSPERDPEVVERLRAKYLGSDGGSLAHARDSGDAQGDLANALSVNFGVPRTGLRVLLRRPFLTSLRVALKDDFSVATLRRFAAEPSVTRVAVTGASSGGALLTFDFLGEWQEDEEAKPERP